MNDYTDQTKSKKAVIIPFVSLPQIETPTQSINSEELENPIAVILASSLEHLEALSSLLSSLLELVQEDNSNPTNPTNPA